MRRIAHILIIGLILAACSSEPDVNRELYSQLHNNGKAWIVHDVSIGEDIYRRNSCDMTAIGEYGTITFISESELEYTYTEDRPARKMTYGFTDTGIVIHGVPYTEWPCFSDYHLDTNFYCDFKSNNLIGESGDAAIIYYLRNS